MLFVMGSRICLFPTITYLRDHLSKESILSKFNGNGMAFELLPLADAGYSRWQTC